MRKGKGKTNGILPNSLRIISSCLKTVSTNASSTVRSAAASVAASVSSSDDHKDQVTWAGFDRLELSPSVFKHVLLLGYHNGFQVLDVEDASNFTELVSKRGGPVSFLQMQPLPSSSDGNQRFRSSHPLLLVVAGDDSAFVSGSQSHGQPCSLGRDCNAESQLGNCVTSPTSVRFYSLKSHCYVHVLRFRSAVRMVRCSPRIIAVGLAAQIYCIDALTLECKFSVLTYPVPHLAGHGSVGVNVGYGPMAVGPRWLAYASNNPLVANTSRLSPQNLTPSPGVSPSTSPGGTSLMARYAMESSKQLAAGIINLGDMGYKTLSKYCQELLPDGSNSPVSSSSGWKVGRLAGSDMDTAGTVVVKDFVSRVVISQFKAHTSPISALSFDPSGTLLVTASVYGNNINVFRIMPSCSRSGSGVQSYDWSSSHVHLYKLHRGITSAMIQDICFSHSSQWIALVSCKGTCHVFVLFPFGSDSGFLSPNSTSKEPSLYPILSLPWWSTSSYIIHQQSCAPPPPVSLSVVSRIKYSSFGWLSTVGSSSGSAAGKVFVPSGAVAAVFYNSISQNTQRANSRTNTLEHLLVYAPSGHVVQHELLPFIGLESSETGSRTQPGSFVHTEDDDLKVKVEPVQWWDVCRRSDWSEREECISVITSGRYVAEKISGKPSAEDNLSMDFLDINDEVNEKTSRKPYSTKIQEKSNWYLSNAEVQVSSVRLPIWQKPEICFYVVDSPRLDNYGDGEFEIEKLPVHEVELKQKELLPVFNHFHSIKSGWNDRGLAAARCINSQSSELPKVEGKISQESVICHSTPASLSSTESSECGSSRRIEHLLDLDQINCEKSYIPLCQTLNDYYHERKGGSTMDFGAMNQNSLTIVSLPPKQPNNGDAHFDNCIQNGLPSSANSSPTAGRVFPKEVPTTMKRTGDVSLLKADNFGSHMNGLVEVPTLQTTQNLVGFGLSFQEGHCKASGVDGCRGSTEVVTDDVDSSSSHCEKEKPEDDEENDEILCGMFDFSDEA